MKKPRISIIGPGRVGTALLKALSNQNFEVITVFSRSTCSENLIKSHPETHFKTGLPSHSNELGELIFITVSDDAIIPVAETIAENTQELVGKFLVHCSGTLTSEALKPLKENGAMVASFHPMKAVTPNMLSFKGTWFDMEGDEAVLSLLENIADELESNSFRVDKEAKPFLHMSAVVASNYLVVLAEIASVIAQKGNISAKIALKALAPLMENTLENVRELGTEEALTGPIARGDVETVRDHIERLKDDEELLGLYKSLGKQALLILKRDQRFSENHLEIETLLS